MPDQPAFVGLFQPQIFKSLLHKAKTSTKLGITQIPSESAQGSADPANPLFAEPSIESEEVLTPRLFLDIVQRQWTSPGSGPNPSGLDKRLYNTGTEITRALQVPTIDAPVVALTSQLVLKGPPEEIIRRTREQNSRWSRPTWQLPGLLKPHRHYHFLTELLCSGHGSYNNDCRLMIQDHVRILTITSGS